MKVLFVVSGNHGEISPIVKNQADALVSAGAEVDYFLICGKGVRGYARNVKPLRQYLRTHSYDAIHAHYSLSGFVASIAGDKPLIVSLMGSDVKASGWYKFIIKLFAKVFSWKAVIIKSYDMYRSLGMRHAVIVPNGVNMERFKSMKKEKCITMLGWNPTKKHILFPANVSRPEKDFALALSAIEQLKDVDIHTFDNVPNAETPCWYNAADVVLMTSKWEGSPNAIKEAMACGCPIVSVAVGDVAERTEGVDGCYIVPTREPKDIADALKQALAVSQRTKGREKIKADGLTNEQVARQIMELYAKVVQG